MLIDRSTLLRRLLLICLLAVFDRAAFAQAKSENPDRAPSQTKEQRQAEQLKWILGASDTEWPVLAPKIARILTLQHERERFIGKPKIPKHDETDGPAKQNAAALPVIDVKPESKKHSTSATTTNADVAVLYSRLVSMASNEHAGAAEMETTLREFRAAQAKSDAELAKAREELRELLTVKQEILLVLMKVLD